MKFGKVRRTKSTMGMSGVLKLKSLMIGKAGGKVAVATPDTAKAVTKKQPQSQHHQHQQQEEDPLRGTSIEFHTDPTEELSDTSFSTISEDSYCSESLSSSDSEGSAVIDDPFLSPFGNDFDVQQPQLEDEKDAMKFRRRQGSKTNKTTPIGQVIVSSPATTTTGHPSLDQRDEPSAEFKASQHSDHSRDAGSQLNPSEEAAAPTKLTSLGTFDFPTIATTAVITSSTKVLAGGSFVLPSPTNEAEEEKACDSQASTGYDTAEPFGFPSPFSMVSKGWRVISSIALPRALQFDILAGHQEQQSPPTPGGEDSSEHESDFTNLSLAHLEGKSALSCNFWNDRVQESMHQYGKIHAHTAESLLQLGYAYMHAREYSQAVVVFQSACRICKQLVSSKEHQLALARVVDAIGMAWTRVNSEEDAEHYHKAMTALEDAFRIRYEVLGAWHIDTVETLNKLAAVHLHLNEYEGACNAYWEVYWVRKAVFGNQHPSVAVAAHALGKVFLHLHATEDAANYFQTAVDIYDQMKLPGKHPAVVRLMRDYNKLDRIYPNRIPHPERPLQQ